MTRQLVSPHVLASQLLYAAKLAAWATPERYETEVCHRLQQLRSELREWEYPAVQKEVEFRLAATRT